MSNKDSAQPQGSQGEPTPETSSKADGQQSSVQEYVTVQEWRNLQTELQKLSRGLQSDKDRAVKGVNSRLDALEGDIKAVLQEALTKGQTVQDVLSQVEEREQADLNQSLRDMVSSWKASQSKGSNGNDSDAGVDVSKVLSELGLPQDDLRVKEFAGKQFSSEVELYREAAKLSTIIHTKKPTDADAPAPQTERSQAAGQQERLMAEYIEGSKGLTGTKLINYKMQMRKKGLQLS